VVALSTNLDDVMSRFQSGRGPSYPYRVKLIRKTAAALIVSEAKGLQKTGGRFSGIRRKQRGDLLARD